MKKWIKIVRLLVLTLPLTVKAGDYAHTTSNGTITITRYTGSSEILTIPDTIDGLPVTSIGDNAFNGAGLGPTMVTIPDSVTSIGVSAFEDCYRLSSIELGNGVTHIGSYAFAFCDALASVWIPSNVTSLGDGVFYECHNLSEVRFFGDVPFAGWDVFSGVPTTVYYLAGTIGWGPTFSGRPTVRMNPAYLLTINNGTGGGSYTNKQRVTIRASAAVGKDFDRWIGDTQYVASVTSAVTTVTIPIKAVTLTATYKDIYYTLTVNDGSGSGSYIYQQQVTVKASNAPIGKVFMWSGNTQYVASVTSVTTKVTMPAQDVTLAATYKDAYTLSVVSGSGSGVYAEQQQVAITASNAPSGQVFYRWTGATQHVANTATSPTFFSMPASNVAVAASYESVNAGDFKYTMDGG